MLKLFTGRKKKDPSDELAKNNGVKESDLLSYHAMAVTDFSSQYGSESSISYTAYNLAGRGNIFPAYGDYTQACVFRTYGEWWEIAPSQRQPFYRTPPSFISQDYIELSFEKKLYPCKLEIYETYNPGCVVRILACERSSDTDVDTGQSRHRWKTLWEGEPTLPHLETDNQTPKSRVFCPPLNKCPFPTDLIRIELCHKLVHYYTELDSVQLYGTKNPINNADDGVGHKDPVIEALEKLSLESKVAGSSLEERTCSQIEGNQQEAEDSDNGYFDMLPEEVIQLILSFQDVLSLCRVARTCRLLHKHSYDSLQYTELNLQPYWTQVNDVALESLESRSRFLQRLNLSWCHGNILSNSAFCSYILTCGQTLRCLYLSSCNFLTAESIRAITESCTNLVELDVSSCQTVQSRGLACIKQLRHLQRLNVYRSLIDLPTTLAIVRSCTDLKHLNLGSCTCITNFDDVLAELGRACPNLISLDLWRSMSVSHVGVEALSEGCPHLQELDLGWCPELKSSSGVIIHLVQKCPKLKKLFLTANRTLCDKDMLHIAKHCPDLEQLDILGTSQVSADSAQQVLENCPKLVFFDVSFCSGIDNRTVEQWNKDYPHVHGIKKSFQEQN